MLDIFLRLKTLVKISHIHIDSSVFRLHWCISSVILLTFSVIITTRQYVGNPIDCIHTNDVPDDVFDLFSTKESQYYVGNHEVEMEWGDVLDLIREIVPTGYVLNGGDNGLEFTYNQQTATVFGLDHSGQPFPISIVLSNIEALSRVTNISAAPAKKKDFNVFKVIVEGSPAPNAFGATAHVRTNDAANFLLDNLKTHALAPNGEQVGLKVLNIQRKKHKALGTTDDSTRTFVWYAEVAAWSPDTSHDPLVVQFPEQDRPKTHMLSSVPEPFNFTWRLHPPEKSERRGPRGAWAASPDSPLVAERPTVLIARPSAAGTPFPATYDHNGERDKFMGDFKSPFFPTPSLARHADTKQAFAVETRDKDHLQRLFTATGNPNIDQAIKGEWTRFPHPTAPHATVAAGSYMATIVSVTSPIICHKCSGLFQWALESDVIAARIQALPAASNTGLNFKPKACGCYAASNKARKRDQQQQHDRSQGQAMGRARREARKAAKTGGGTSSAHSAQAP